MWHVPLNRLTSLALGCVDWSIADHAWHPQRMPAPLRPICLETQGFRVRMQAPAGVRLRFSTNSRSIHLALRFGEAARPRYRAALVVDDLPPVPVGPDQPADQWAGQIFNHPIPAPRRFDLWLPFAVETDILQLALDDRATLTPAPPAGPRWLVYGDSITQGMVADLPTSTAIARATLALDADALNLGIGGAIADPRLPLYIPPGPWNLISIAYGANDFAHAIPADLHADRLRALLLALRSAHPDVPILLLTCLTWVDRAPNSLNQSLADYRRAQALAARDIPRVTVVDGASLVPHDPDCFVDKLHPNDRGFEHYARCLLPHLRTALA